jgi:hypothetical protein
MNLENTLRKELENTTRISAEHETSTLKRTPALQSPKHELPVPIMIHDCNVVGNLFGVQRSDNESFNNISAAEHRKIFTGRHYYIGSSLLQVALLQ